MGWKFLIAQYKIIKFRTSELIFKRKWLPTLLVWLLHETEIFHRMLEFQNTAHFNSSMVLKFLFKIMVKYV
jgi:hypothetical protein